MDPSAPVLLYFFDQPRDFFILTSHVISLYFSYVFLILTSHVFSLYIFSYFLYMFLNSHVIFFILTSHVIFFLLTSHVIFFILTSHVISLYVFTFQHFASELFYFCKIQFFFLFFHSFSIYLLVKSSFVALKCSLQFLLRYRYLTFLPSLVKIFFYLSPTVYFVLFFFFFSFCCCLFYPCLVLLFPLIFSTRGNKRSESSAKTRD